MKGKKEGTERQKIKNSYLWERGGGARVFGGPLRASLSSAPLTFIFEKLGFGTCSTNAFKNVLVLQVVPRARSSNFNGVATIR